MVLMLNQQNRHATCLVCDCRTAYLGKCPAIIGGVILWEVHDNILVGPAFKVWQDGHTADCCEVGVGGVPRYAAGSCKRCLQTAQYRPAVC